MTNAGISLRDSIYEAVTSTKNKQIKQIGKRAKDDIEAGLSLSDSLSHYQYEVGIITIAMIKMGEVTGTLGDSFIKLALMLDEIKANKDSLKKALKMPLISLSVLIIAFIFLITVIVPKFKKIFSKLGSDLPAPTQLLLFLEHTLSSYGIFILIGLGVGFIIHSNIGGPI